MNYPQAVQGQAIAQGVAGLVGTQNLQAATQQPRITAAAERLEHLVDQLEKTLHGAHSHIDRVAGPPAPKQGNGYGTERDAASPISQIARIEFSINRLQDLVHSNMAGLFERLGQL